MSLVTLTGIAKSHGAQHLFEDRHDVWKQTSRYPDLCPVDADSAMLAGVVDAQDTGNGQRLSRRNGCQIAQPARSPSSTASSAVRGVRQSPMT